MKLAYYIFQIGILTKFEFFIRILYIIRYGNSWSNSCALRFNPISGETLGEYWWKANDSMGLRKVLCGF